tara:strand:+ start:11565 stop:12464 length:900 start_codon:yes stop_codon:yes gene_type:complete
MAEPMQVEENEDVEIELEAAESEVGKNEEIEVEPTKKETVTEKSDSGKEEKPEEEIAEYSESVKKRINKLTYKIREAERREKAAIEYAQNVQEKLNNTQATLSQKDKNLYDEYSARVQSQLNSAESAYRKAHDIGDTDAMLESQKDVAKLAVELESLKRVKPEEAKEQKVETATQPAPKAPPTPDPQAQEWANKNDWFGSDLAMTTSAFAFHKELVEKEGFDPASSDYYKQIDKRMAEAFPHKLGNTPPPNVQENVTNSSRGARGKTGKGRTVKLTPSQVAIAKRLGVPLEEYAKHVKS